MAFSSSVAFTSSSLSLIIAVALLYGTVTSFKRTVPFAAVRKERIFWQAICKRTLPFIRSRLSVYNAVRAAILCGNGLIILRMRKKSMPLFNDPLQNTSDSPRVLLRRGRRFLMIRGKTRVSKQRHGDRNSVSTALSVIFFLRHGSRRPCGVYSIRSRGYIFSPAAIPTTLRRYISFGRGVIFSSAAIAPEIWLYPLFHCSFRDCLLFRYSHAERSPVLPE